MDRKPKIGIMGGTFNPVHNGHIALARKAKEYLQLDKVMFIPSGISYMKEDVLSATDRYRMTELAISRYSDFCISDIEMRRQGNTYTVDTLKELKKQNPDCEYYFIMGADSLYAIETWQHPEQICQLCIIVCAVREDYSLDELQEHANYLKETLHAKIVLLPMERIDISSTEIRNAIATGQNIVQYIPASVADYIKRNHIYE